MAVAEFRSAEDGQCCCLTSQPQERGRPAVQSSGPRRPPAGAVARAAGTHREGKEQRCWVKTAALWSAGQAGRGPGGGGGSCPWPICLQRGAETGAAGAAAASRAGPGPAGAGAAGSAAAG